MILCYQAFFLAWAKRSGIEVDPELEKAVVARGVLVADWKTLYDKQGSDWKALYEKSEAEWKALLDKKSALIDEQAATIVELHEARKKTAPLVAAPTPAEREDGVSARERDSLLKLVIGMAVAGYKYDPKAQRSPYVSEIAHDLETVGVPLDVDTVRKWLREAGEILPPQQTE